MTHRSQLAETTPAAYYCPGDPLILRGDIPLEVYVRLEHKRPLFSQDRQNWHTSIRWECQQKEQYALIITYHLLKEDLELKPSAITPTLYFSPVQEGKQIGYLPWSSVPVTFHINVSDRFHLVDPEIIVTPIEAFCDTKS